MPRGHKMVPRPGHKNMPPGSQKGATLGAQKHGPGSQKGTPISIHEIQYYIKKFAIIRLTKTLEIFVVELLVGKCYEICKRCPWVVKDARGYQYQNELNAQGY